MSQRVQFGDKVLQQNILHFKCVGVEESGQGIKKEQAMIHWRLYLPIVVDRADRLGFGLSHFCTMTEDVRGHSLKLLLVQVLEYGRPS